MKKCENIKIHSNQKAGNIKKVNGGTLAPPITTEKSARNIRNSFQALNMPLTRLSDAPLENAGARLVDIPLIFANFHADETDPRNYYFRQTDDYIRNCIEGGTPVLYRLGTSIEHGINKYFTEPPHDVNKWINICDRVIRHYTEGWANGFNFKIIYWEIWNEPEITDAEGVHLMWSGSVQEYNEFYVTVATELKKRFPHLKFGGPAHASYGKYSEAFIRFCADHNAPLDFYSFHCYTNDPYGWIQEAPSHARKDLDKAGYKNTEIHLNEWHYFPGDWRRLRSDCRYQEIIYQEMKGLDSAAFLTTVLALWQDTPLDMGCYYTSTTTNWGLYKKDSDIQTKSYYGMKAFGEIVRFPERLKAVSPDKNITVLAGSDEQDQKCLLISCFKTGPRTLNIENDASMKGAKIFILDNNYDLEEIRPDIKEKKLSFSFDSESAVILIRF